jgi:hypothetical protein
MYLNLLKQSIIWNGGALTWVGQFDQKIHTG